MDSPDRWVLVKITPPDGETVYKVLAGWLGGYCGSDYYRLNSGVVRAERFEQGWDFHGFSGSVYRCYDRNWGFTNLSATVFENLKEAAYSHRLTVVDLVPEEVDIATLNWSNS